MKLLYLLPSVPEPADSGARLRNRGLLRLAAAHHRVDAIVFGHPDQAAALDSLVRTGTVVPSPPDRSRLERATGTATSLLPDMAERLWSPAFLEALQRALASEEYDVVQAEGIEMARYLRAIQLSPAIHRPLTIYDAHNAEFLLQRRAFETAAVDGLARTPAAAYSLLQWRKLEAFEADIVRHADLTLAVSSHDANQLEALVAGDATATREPNVHVVPNAIDVSDYPFAEPQTVVRPSILYLGKLDYRPNAEALRWLVDEVLPQIWRGDPLTRLFVVGDGAPHWLIAAGQSDDRIAVVGRVDDERPYLARTQALLLPMRSGGGSRLKALVGMAAGTPIVSTRLGMEGIQAEPGSDFLLADGAPPFAEAVLSLLGNVDRRRALAASARALVERRYDWSAIAPTLNAAYASLTPQRPRIEPVLTA